MTRLLPLLLLSATTANAADPLRDPMRPPMAASEHSGPRYSEPAVTAVFISSDHRAAIVDGRLIHAGDLVGDSTIDEVLNDGIRYHRGSVSRELHLAHSATSIKKSASLPARDNSGAP